MYNAFLAQMNQHFQMCASRNLDLGKALNVYGLALLEVTT